MKQRDFTSKMRLFIDDWKRLANMNIWDLILTIWGLIIWHVILASNTGD